MAKRVLSRAVVVIFGFLLLVPLVIAVYVNLTQGVWPAWSGFGQVTGPILQPNEQFQPGKTYWDLLQLLIIPIFLAVGAYLLNASARKGDLQIAEERSQESVLQNYLDDLGDLLLTNDLRKNREGQFLATARTITTLRMVNGVRRGFLLRFLHDANLIERDNPIINLENANLEDAKLQQADLHGACLRGVDLRGADLRGANLVDVDMSKANLVNANLSAFERKISRGFRIEYLAVYTTKLFKANLTDADLRGADLRGALLRETELGGATLVKADFRSFTAWKSLSRVTIDGTDENSLKAALRGGGILSLKQRRAAKQLDI